MTLHSSHICNSSTGWASSFVWIRESENASIAWQLECFQSCSIFISATWKLHSRRDWKSPTSVYLISAQLGHLSRAVVLKVLDPAAWIGPRTPGLGPMPSPSSSVGPHLALCWSTMPWLPICCPAQPSSLSCALSPRSALHRSVLPQLAPSTQSSVWGQAIWLTELFTGPEIWPHGSIN